MLTVGFGDIAPTNTSEALCMILIETFSCVVLAYNVNCVGNIISSIRSYDVLKHRDLKIFNQINEENQLSETLATSVKNYIKESAELKRNFNIEEESGFI